MSFFDANIIITPVDVTFSEDFGFAELANDVCDKGKWVSVFDGDFI